MILPRPPSGDEASKTTPLKSRGRNGTWIERHPIILTKERRKLMGQQFMRVEEVAEILDVSTSYAYKVIRELNEELKRKGFITISGRVNRECFNERLYQARRENKNACL